MSGRERERESGRERGCNRERERAVEREGRARARAARGSSGGALNAGGPRYMDGLRRLPSFIKQWTPYTAAAASAVN